MTPDTYKIQNRHLHHTLIEVGRLVLDDLDSHHFLRLQVLAFYHLTESALSQHIENEVSIPVIQGCQMLMPFKKKKRQAKPRE